MILFDIIIIVCTTMAWDFICNPECLFFVCMVIRHLSEWRSKSWLGLYQRFCASFAYMRAIAHKHSLHYHGRTPGQVMQACSLLVEMELFVFHSTELGEMLEESMTQCFLHAFFSLSSSVLSIFNAFRFYLSPHSHNRIFRRSLYISILNVTCKLKTNKQTNNCRREAIAFVTCVACSHNSV